MRRLLIIHLLPVAVGVEHDPRRRRRRLTQGPFGDADKRPPYNLTCVEHAMTISAVYESDRRAGLCRHTDGSTAANWS